MNSATAGSGKSILVVDSEAAILELLRIFLGSAGFAVRTATSSKQALDLCRQHTPDLALAEMDLDSPDDLHFLSQLRNGHPTMKTCVMCASGRGYEPAELACLGIAHLFSKPFALQRLIEVFGQLTNRPAGASEGPPVGFN